MSGEGGSTTVVTGPDWVLVELPMPEMRYPRARFSAFVEAPFDALDGVGEFDPLPIQGIAYDQAISGEYVLDPVIAFPYANVAPLTTIAEEKWACSLLVDLRGFAGNVVVHIGLYGYVDIYNLTAQVTDGPFSGTVISSDFYGNLGIDTSGAVAPMTPLQIAGFSEGLLHIPTATDPFGHDTLVLAFPELTGHAYVYSDDLLGTVPPVAFDWDAVAHPDQWWVPAADAVPNDNPNAFMVLAGVLATTYTYWAPGIVKTAHTEGSGAQYDNMGPVLDSVSTPPPGGTGGVSVFNSNFTNYFVPTVTFTNDRPVPVNVTAAVGANLWTEQVQHDMPRPAHSYSWETVDYPDRPEMANIGTGIVVALDHIPDAFVVPFDHFSHRRIGTITIARATGEVAFLPDEAAPVDGGETGDGPDGDGTAPGRTANPQLRAWTYSLDGHDFYVLRLGDSLTLVYDLYSEQWMDWTDFSSLTWRAHCGFNWGGGRALADTYGSSVVVGDDAYGLLWFLDPNQPFDDDPLGGVTPSYFSRVTVGQVPMTGREVLPCYATWLTTDMGDPAYLGAGVTLYTSDDAGDSWDNHGFVGVTPGENSPELSWYSLGQISAPGRLFKIFDNGAIARIDALEMNDPDDK